MKKEIDSCPILKAKCFTWNLCHISLSSLTHTWYIFISSILNLDDLWFLHSKEETFWDFRLWLCTFVNWVCVWWCLTATQTRKITVHQPPRTRRSLNFIKHSSFQSQSASHLLFSSCSIWSTSVVVAPPICLLSECELLSSLEALSPRYSLISAFLLWWVSSCEDLCFFLLDRFCSFCYLVMVGLVL